jgi:hypothetical protein
VNGSENTNIDFNSIENTTIENTNIDFNSIDNTTIRSTNKTNKNEPSKNLTNKNEPIKNNSVVGDQSKKNSLGSDKSIEEENLSVFDNVEGLTPKIEVYNSPSFDYSVLIDEDQLLRSIYFGSTINEKLLKEYLNNEVKNKLSYLQFEKMFINTLLIKLKYYTKPFERFELIELLNEDFKKCYEILSVNNLVEDRIVDFLKNEISITKSLENFKL